LAYKPLFISQRTLFFSHTKPANSTFSHGYQTSPNEQGVCSVFETKGNYHIFSYAWEFANFVSVQWAGTTVESLLEWWLP